MLKPIRNEDLSTIRLGNSQFPSNSTKNRFFDSIMLTSSFLLGFSKKLHELIYSSGQAKHFLSWILLLKPSRTGDLSTIRLGKQSVSFKNNEKRFCTTDKHDSWSDLMVGTRQQVQCGETSATRTSLTSSGYSSSWYQRVAELPFGSLSFELLDHPHQAVALF